MDDKKVLSTFMSGYSAEMKAQCAREKSFEDVVGHGLSWETLKKLKAIIDATTLAPGSMGALYLESQDYDLMCEDEYV